MSASSEPTVDIKAQQRVLLEAMMHLNMSDDKFKDLSKEDQKKKAIEHLASKGVKYVEVATPAPAATGGSKAQQQQQKNEKNKQQQQQKELPPKILNQERDAQPKRDPEDVNKFPTPGKGKKRQTWPEPTIPVRQQWDVKKMPLGDEMPHFPLELNNYRLTSAEKRAAERMPLFEQKLFDLRQAAEVHRQIRTWVGTWLKPDIPLMTIADRIENKLEQLIVKDGIKRGQAFPTGVNINHIAAHDTCNTGDTKRMFTEKDVMKIDFGTQINGHIIDCAWTVHFDSTWDPLVEATKAATREGIKHAGVDARLGEIGEHIQEVMESYEVEVGGKTLQVKSIKNLSGHSIDPYIIHAGKSVPIVKNHEAVKMEEGEVFAIETFGSTGKGSVYEDLECSHYMAQPGAAGNLQSIRSDGARSLLKNIDQYFSTLAFCRKWLDNKGCTKHTLALKQLCDAGAVTAYPPLVDVKGSMTSQSEHTLILKPTCKEVLSRGEDF